MNYLVMECHTSYAVLLDEDGRFVKSANLNYEIGQTVRNPVLMRDKPLEKIKEKRNFPTKIMATVLAVAAIFAFFIGGNYYQNNFQPYSSIFMAINPEVEMVLNRNGQVLEVSGVNEDGIALLEGYKLPSEDKVEVANDLVDRAIEMGFLAEGGRVSIAIDTPDQMLFEQYGVELRKELDGRVSITIEITDLENRQPADERKTPPEPEPEPEEPSPVPESKPEPAPEPTPAPEAEPVPEPAPAPEPAAPQMISLAEAKQIAFNHAGINGANAVFDEEDLETDDGITYYDLEFDVGENEYQYEINAYTGAIIDYDIDLDD